MPYLTYSLYRVSQKSRPYLTRYIWVYENSIATKEVYLDNVTIHKFCDTKHDPIDGLFIRIKMDKFKIHKTILE